MKLSEIFTKARVKWLSVGGTLCLMVGYGLQKGSEVLLRVSPTSRPVFIPKGASLEKMGHLLTQQGVIVHPYVLMVTTVLTGVHHQLKWGEYDFSTVSTLADILSLLAEGKTVRHSFTLPEGLTSKEILDKLANEPLLEGPVPLEVPEGSLLPETVYFKWGESRATLLTRYQKMADDIKAQFGKLPRDLSLLPTWTSVLTLASIVEKETSLPHERPRIAAVFLNRLRLGMPLQSDPTVIYGRYLKDKTPFNQGLSRQDLLTETAFNTYRLKALPPHPICHPGKEAIWAVLNAPVTQELFFVADGSGGHIFAKTLNEHQKNHRAWRQIRDQSPSS
jgi:UPF0755 protein